MSIISIDAGIDKYSGTAQLVQNPNSKFLVNDINEQKDFELHSIQEVLLKPLQWTFSVLETGSRLFLI